MSLLEIIANFNLFLIRSRNLAVLLVASLVLYVLFRHWCLILVKYDQSKVSKKQCSCSRRVQNLYIHTAKFYVHYAQVYNYKYYLY